jgi:glucokinase
MDFLNDKRIVMTLDAGGTNFVFSAIQGGKEIISPVCLPSNAADLEKCLATLISGFETIKRSLSSQPAAISFAFPGPADYPNGVIGELGNLPAFKGDVALGPMLEEKFGLPVFINNDGDLYTYGEAIAGYLPYINQMLKKAKSPKRFHNLAGFTIGTGFGGGIVRDGVLFTGDNSGAGEVWLLRNKIEPDMGAEESISIRAVQRVYAEVAGISREKIPSPKEIFEIGTGRRTGNKEAAIEAYRRLGEVLGDAIANVLTLVDGIAVIGGGIAGAHSLFLPIVVAEMNSTYRNHSGEVYRRLAQQAFNLENEQSLRIFLKGESREITIPLSRKKLIYDPLSRVGVGVSRLGTSKAVSIGAYAFALNQIG